jgi:hypothetical protein
VPAGCILTLATVQFAGIGHSVTAIPGEYPARSRMTTITGEASRHGAGIGRVMAAIA